MSVAESYEQLFTFACQDQADEGEDDAEDREPAHATFAAKVRRSIATLTHG
jgi:hypothetical protein